VKARRADYSARDSRASRRNNEPTRAKPLFTMPAPSKKGSGKQSKAGRREAIEREYAEAQRINAETVSCTKRLIEVLLSGGVPESSLAGLRKCSVVKEEVDGSAREVGKQQIDDLMNSLIQLDVVADESWSFAFCYPPM
jgi:hypothetical protein